MLPFSIARLDPLFQLNEAMILTSWVRLVRFRFIYVYSKNITHVHHALKSRTSCSLHPSWQNLYLAWHGILKRRWIREEERDTCKLNWSQVNTEGVASLTTWEESEGIRDEIEGSGC
jgi:hypothetical protein